MIGNEEDFTACLGFEVPGNDATLKTLSIKGYGRMIEEAVKVYPNFQVVATTLRAVKTATVNDWSAICWAERPGVYPWSQPARARIYDRVGGGDSFASGSSTANDHGRRAASGQFRRCARRARHDHTGATPPWRA